MTKRSPWTQLAESLKNGEYSAEQLERLSSRVSVEAHQTTLEHEIRREMAEALGRADTKIQRALEALEAAGRDADAATDEAQKKACNERFNELRTAALDARLDLVIQREAIGIRRNDRLERLYPVPPRR